VPVTQAPTSSVFKGQRCGGVQIIVDDWASFRPVKTGLATAWTLHRLYPEAWNVKNYDRLLSHKLTFDSLQAGVSWQEMEKGWQSELDQFLQLRRRYLLYAE
jgi:uncharacterized protein YbbC (DUF1343 family)